MIRAKFILTVGDYIEFRRLYLRSKQWLHYLRRILLLCAAGISFAGVCSWWLDPRDWQAGLALFLFGCIVLPPSLTPIAKASLRQQFKKHPLLNEEIILIANEEHLRLETKSAKMELQWDAFSSLLESGDLFRADLFVLMIRGEMIRGEQNGWVVPRRGFVAAEAANFGELLHRKLPRN